MRGEETDCLGHGWLKDAAVDGRIGSAMCGKDLAGCEKGRESSALYVSTHSKEGNRLRTCF